MVPLWRELEFELDVYPRGCVVDGMIRIEIELGSRIGIGFEPEPTISFRLSLEVFDNMLCWVEPRDRDESVLGDTRTSMSELSIVLSCCLGTIYSDIVTSERGQRRGRHLNRRALYLLVWGRGTSHDHPRPVSHDCHDCLIPQIKSGKLERRLALLSSRALLSFHS
jgi:hypothetical protein